MAQFYGVAIMPARPYKARDKAKVEAAVLLSERWLIAVLRHDKFFSLADLKRMATGDGWQRLVRIEDAHDPLGYRVVTFDDYRPHTMREYSR